MKIGIIGLGLIGGSLALSLKKIKFVSKVYGYDINKTHEKEAISLGLVCEIASFENIKKCDIIFLAIPVEAIIKILPNFQDIDENTTIIDLGSTKKEIIQSVPEKIRNNFLAAHPMAGTEKNGPSAAFDTLFHNEIVVFCDTANTKEIHKLRAVEIFSHIGMKIVFMNADSHDKHAAFISHMPHVISYALANSVLRQEEKKNILLLAGGGFKSMSRIAKSSPLMWSDVFKQNKNYVLNAIDVFEDELRKIKQNIHEEKWDEVCKLLENANKLHDIL